MSCQTCYSEIPPSSTPYLTPCCSTPICGRCIARNPRLKEYDPCLRCCDVRTENGLGRIKRGQDEARRRDREAESGQFSIGDDEDDEDDHEYRAVTDQPPGYSSVSGSPKSACSRLSARSTHSRNSQSSPAPPADRRGSGGEPSQEDQEVVEITHPVSRSDTVLSIARKYAADPHDLLTLNDLPPTALTSNTRIVQTRRRLIISRRRVPRGTTPNPSPLLFDAGASLDAAIDPEEAKRREEERRVKRFQLISKTVDPGVGRAYLALEGDGDGEERHPLESGSGEAMPRKAEAGMEGSGKKKVVGGGSKEERALEAFFEDEEWEREVGTPQRVRVDGRWMVVGSNIGVKV